MLIAMRKHTKAIFWVIILLIVPAFIVLYLPQQLRQQRRISRYGSIFDKTVTTDQYGDAYRAQHRALTDFASAIVGMEHRKPQNDFVRVRRELILAEFAKLEHQLRWLSEQRGQPMGQLDIVLLEQVRDSIKNEFTDPETGLYDEPAYRERLREVGMTDEQYVIERRDNEKVFRFLGQVPLERLAWERLMLAHEAKRLDIPVSDDEVADYLRMVCPGPGGTIDEERYLRRLRSAGKARSEYEDEIRMTIRIAKLQRMVLDAVKVPGQDAVERFDKRYETYKLAYHLEPVEPLIEPAALREDEVVAFYTQARGHPAFAAEFQVEPKVAVLYVLIEANDYRSQVEVGDADLKDYYESHRETFVADDGTPLPLDMCTKQVRDAVVEREAIKLARSKAARLFLVSSAPRLIQQAAKHNAEVHRTPLFGEEGPIDELIAEDEELFRHAALGHAPYAAKTRPVPGQVIGPIKVAQGWCILSPTQVVPDLDGRARPHYEVMGAARAEAARQKASFLAGRMASDLFKEVRRTMTDEEIGFVEACNRLEIDVEETGFLSVADEIPGLEGGEDLLPWAAMVKQREPELGAEGAVSEYFHLRSVDEGILFFDVVETRVPDDDARAKQLPPFVRNEVRRLLRSEAYGEWLAALYEQAKIVDLAAEERARQLEAQRQQQPVPVQP